MANNIWAYGNVNAVGMIGNLTQDYNLYCENIGRGSKIDNNQVKGPNDVSCRNAGRPIFANYSPGQGFMEVLPFISGKYAALKLVDCMNDFAYCRAICISSKLVQEDPILVLSRMNSLSHLYIFSLLHLDN